MANLKHQKIHTKCEHTIEHLTAFGKRLDDDQRALVRSDVTIADDDKLQFYLEEIYDSNRFDKQEMLTWERQPTATKTDFDLAKAQYAEPEDDLPPLEQTKQNSSKPLRGRSSIMGVQSTARYSRLSAHLQLNKQN